MEFPKLFTRWARGVSAYLGSIMQREVDSVSGAWSCELPSRNEKYGKVSMIAAAVRDFPRSDQAVIS